MNDAGRVIEAFGGIRPMAKKLGVAVTTIQGWKERNAIPVQRLDQIREAARREGIDLGVVDSAPAEKKDSASKATAPTAGSQRAETATDTSTARSTSDQTSPTNETKAGAAAASAASRASARPAEAEKVTHTPSGIKASESSSSGNTIDGRNAEAASAKSGGRKAFGFGLGFAVALLIGVALGWYFKDAIVGAMDSGEASAAMEKRLTSAEAAAAAAKKAADDAAAQANKLAAQVKAAETELAAVKKTAASGAAPGSKKLADDLKALRADLDAFKKAAAGTASGANTKLTGDVAKLRDAVAALRKSMAQGASGAGSGGASGADASTKSALDKLTTGLAALSGKVAALAQKNAAAETSKALDSISGKLASLETRLKSVEAGGGGKAGLVVALSQLRAAAASGRSYAPSLKVAKSLAGDDSPAEPVLKALEPAAAKGAPTLPVLKSRFDALSSSLISTAVRAEGTNWVDRAWNRVKSTVVVRRTGRNVKGNDAQALVAQAEVKLEDGDLAGAVAIVRKLPSASQKVAAEWLADASRRTAINASLAKLDAMMPTLSGAAPADKAKTGKAN